MSTTVDNRVVEMRFDNKEFESGVSTSISSLEKLKKSLNLKDAADGFDDLDKATKKLDFVGLGNAIEAINNKFSILGTISDQILRRIGDAIYDVQAKAISLVKSLSVDQISAGWGKYAEKTESVKTIMAATAKDYDDIEVQMADVNAQLEKLNWFTDETSYNFVDMTNNIGKFTSNGQKLDASVTAMQGIAVWAAISGANAGEASRAMYNLSQALSTGGVKLIDWKSIENANMATVEFKQTAIDTAVAMGTLKQKSDGVYETLAGHEVTLKSFNQNLSDVWFTSEVLMATLDKYGGFTNELNAFYDAINGDYETVTTSQLLQYIEDYSKGTLDLGKTAQITGLEVDELESRLQTLSSAEFDLGRRAFRAAQEAITFEQAINATKDAVSTGWMNTFELIFGNYDEAKKLWTAVANEMWSVFAGGGAERNGILRDWHKSAIGGYEQLWQGVSNMWEGIKGIASRIGEVWSSIFPGLSADKLIEVTEKFYAFSEKFKNTFAGVEEAISEITDSDAIEAAVGATETAVNAYSKTVEALNTLVDQVWGGVWGNGDERRRALEEAGYVYEIVQNAVNRSVGIADAYVVDEEALAAAVGETVAVLDEATSVTEELEGASDASAEAIGTISEGAKEATDELEDLADAEDKSRTSADDLADILGGIGSAISLLIEAGKLAGKYLVFPALRIGAGVIRKALSVLAPFASAFTDFVNKLKENNTLEKNIQKIQMWLTGVFNLASQSEKIQKFLGYWQQFKDWIGGIKDDALNRLTSFFDKIANYNIELPSFDDAVTWLENAADTINRIIEAVQTGWPQIKAFFEGLDFSGVSEFASSAATMVSEFFTNLFTNDEVKEAGRGWIGSFIDGVIEKIEETDWGNILNIILKGLSTAVGTSIGFGFADLLFGLGDATSGFAKIPNKVAGILGGVKQVLIGYSWDLKADALLKVAFAIGIFAASLIGLSLVPAGRLVTVAGSLIPIIGALIGLAAVIGYFWGTANEIQEAVQGSLISIGKIKVKIPKLALTLGAFAAALMSIVAAVAVFGYMPWAKLKQGLLVLAGVVLGLATVLGLLSRYGGDMKNAAGMAKGFIGIALALDLLIPVITVMTLLATIQSGGALWNATFALIAIIATLAIALGVLSKNTTDIKGIGGQFVLMALALDLLLPVLVVLTAVAAFNLGAMWSAVGAVSVMLIAMAGAFLLMSVAVNKVRSPKTVIAALLTMAVGVVAVAAALKILSGEKFGDMMKAAGAIAIVVVAFGALGFVAGTFPQIAIGMLAIGAAVTLLGAGLALAGVGALAFAKALQLLSDSSVDAKAAGTNLAEGIVAFFDILMSKGQSIVQFIALIIAAILAVIVAHKANIVMTMVGVVEALAQALTSGGTLAIILTAIGALLAALLVWLGEKFANLASALVSLVLILLASVVKGILDNLPMIRMLITSLIQTIWAVIAEVLIGIADAFIGPFVAMKPDSKLAQWWNGIKSGVDQMASDISSDVDAALGDLQANVDKNAEELKSSASAVDEAMSEVDSALSADDMHREQLEVRNILPYSAEDITQETTAVADAANSGSASIDTAFGSLTSTIDGGMESLNGLGDATNESGLNFGLGFSDGVAGSTDTVLGSISTLATDSTDALNTGLGEHSPSTITEQSGAYFDEGLALGINNWSWLVTAATLKLANAALSSLKYIGYKAYWYGYYFDAGLANGVSAYSYLVTSKVNTMANSALNTLAATLNSHSPSKATEEYGKFFDQGFGLGVEKNSNIIDDAVESASSNALNGIKAVVTRIIDAINGDFDASMTITPVLDLSNIQNGATRIGEMLNSGSIGYSTGMANLAARTLNRSSEQTASTPTSKVELTNNFYVQRMDEGMVDYFVNRINTELGARV